MKSLGGVRCVSGCISTQAHGILFLFYFWEEAEFQTDKTRMLSTGGFQKSSSILSLFSRQ